MKQRTSQARFISRHICTVSVIIGAWVSLEVIMKANYRAVVIGGGVVGASVLYHLAKLGWRDIVLLEREVLTAGSSWHAAGGFHALNADPNIAALQAYTIDLLSEIEKESGQSVGMH